MKYMVARFLQEQEELSYRAYTTDALQLIAENSARLSRDGKGRYPAKRWAELIDQKPAETRSGDEIAADVIKRCGLKVI